MTERDRLAKRLIEKQDEMIDLLKKENESLRKLLDQTLDLARQIPPPMLLPVPISWPAQREYPTPWWQIPPQFQVTC